MDNWGFKINDVCDTEPVTRDNLDRFVGREEIVKNLKSQIKEHGVMIIEGDIGIGKTSLGNYVRWSDSSLFSPVELKCQPTWSNKDFLHNLLALLIQELLSNEKYNKLKKNKVVKDLLQRYTNSMPYGLGVTIATVGIQGSTGGVSRPSEYPEELLLSNFKDMCKVILNEGTLDRIVIQLNNLDLDHSFLDKKLSIDFFNGIRDILQIKEVCWILNGSIGLEYFLKDKVNRMGQIISLGLEVPALSFEEFYSALKTRASLKNKDAFLPVSKEVIKLIYEASNGSIREALNNLNRIFKHFIEFPLKNEISLDEIKLFYKNFYKVQIESVTSKHKDFEIMIHFLKSKPGISHNDLAEKMKVKKANLSKLMKSFIDSGWVVSCHDEEDSRIKRYYLSTRSTLCF